MFIALPIFSFSQLFPCHTHTPNPNTCTTPTTHPPTTTWYIIIMYKNTATTTQCKSLKNTSVASTLVNTRVDWGSDMCCCSLEGIGGWQFPTIASVEKRNRRPLLTQVLRLYWLRSLRNIDGSCAQVAHSECVYRYKYHFLANGLDFFAGS